MPSQKKRPRPKLSSTENLECFPEYIDPYGWLEGFYKNFGIYRVGEDPKIWRTEAYFPAEGICSTLRDSSRAGLEQQIDTKTGVYKITPACVGTAPKDICQIAQPEDYPWRRLKNAFSKIRELYEKGLYDAAIRLAEAYPNLISSDSLDTQNAILLGDIYVKKGMRDKAISYYRRSGKSIEEGYDRAGYLTFKDKNFEESEYWFRLNIQHNIAHPSKGSRYSIARACKRLGQIHLEKNEPGKALSFLRKAQQLGASHIKRYLKKAEQFSKGRMELDDILKLIPEFPPLTVEEMLQEATNIAKDIIKNHLYYNVMDEFWTEECTKAFMRSLARWEACWWDNVDEVVRILGPKRIRRIKEKLEENDLEWNPNMIMKYAMDKRNRFGLSYNQPQYKRCKLCGEIFFEACIEGSLASRLEFPARPVDFCPKCLASAFLGAFKQPKSREAMKTDLRKLVEALGFIPPQGFMSIGTYSSLLGKLPREKLVEVVPVMVGILPHEIYVMEFGSWLKALIESGVLSDDAKREVYGTRCLAKDGHECLSIAEKIIDDWLSANSIPHLKDPSYPSDEALNPEGSMRADWKVGDVFIEFFGLVGVPEYEDKVKQKRELAKKTHINLIEIYPDDLYDLNRKLGKLINQLA